MPPKTAATANEATLTSADIDCLKAVLKEVESFKVNWAKVAPKIGITRSDNA